MARACTAAALFLIAGCSTEHEPSDAEPAVELDAADHAPELPPRATIAGFSGLRTRSTVLFDSSSTQPHSLHVVFGFPERGVWRLEPGSGRRTRRVLLYRAGREVYVVPSEGAESKLLTGRDGAIALLQMELRQAALLWPDGLAWTAGRDPDRVTIEGCGSIEALGAGEAGARPVAFQSFLPDGEAVETLSELVWDERSGRTWPVAWTLATPAGIVWRESLDEVEPGGVYADHYFLPPDRLRGADARAQEAPEEPQRVALPARIGRSFALPPGADWLEALDEARGRLEAGARALGIDEMLDPRVGIELAGDGAPTAVELRLARRDGPAPDGWRRSEAGDGISQFVSDPRAIDRVLLDRLLSDLAEREVGGTPYLVLEPGAGPRAEGQLVLPIR